MIIKGVQVSATISFPNSPIYGYMILQKTEMKNRIVLKYHLIISSLAIICLQGCEKEYPHQYIIYSQNIKPLSESRVSIQSVLADRQADEIKYYGYCWSIDPSPTILKDTSMQTREILGNEFESYLKGLSVGKQYYVKAYIIDRAGSVHYGNELKFLNSFSPSFTITRLNAITENYFEVFSELSLKGNDQITEYGHVWSKTELPTLTDSHSSYGNLNSQQNIFSYTTQITDLDKSTKYYVRPYIINKWGVFYGTQIVIPVPEKIVPGQWTEAHIPEGKWDFILKGSSDLYIFESYNYTNGIIGRKVNLVSNEEVPIKTLPCLVDYQSRGFLINGKVYAGFGYRYSVDTSGYSIVTSLFDMWEYTPETDTWNVSDVTTGTVIEAVSITRT